MFLLLCYNKLFLQQVNKKFLYYQNRPHQKNNLVDAETLYNQILKIDSNHFETIFLLGSLYAQCRNFNKSKDAGLTYIKYYGDVIPTSRDHCKNMVGGVYDRRKSGIFTIDEVRKLWNRSWSGKKSGNPLIVRGGYNCRHQWSYVNPDWYDSKGELII